MVQLKITFAETWLQRVTRRIIFWFLTPRIVLTAIICRWRSGKPARDDSFCLQIERE